MEKYYMIKEEDLLSLLEDSAILRILEADGVDNWIGYMEDYTAIVAGMLDMPLEEAEEQNVQTRDVVEKWIKEYKEIPEEIYATLNSNNLD